MPPRFYILLSCAPGFKSWESPELGGGHGVFTWFLVEGLNGRADREDSTNGNRDGVVGIQEAFRYAHAKTRNYEIYEKVRKPSGEVERRRYYQNPTSSGVADEDFPLTVYAPDDKIREIRTLLATARAAFDAENYAEALKNVAAAQKIAQENEFDAEKAVCETLETQIKDAVSKLSPAEINRKITAVLTRVNEEYGAGKYDDALKTLDEAIGSSPTIP